MNIEHYKEYIETHIDLIDNNDYDELYENIDDSEFYGSQLTEVLWEADIDPLKTINHIPEGYLQGYEKDEFHIPDHITQIKPYAFLGSNIKRLYIGKSLKYIAEYAFAECEHIEEVHISSLSQWCNLIFSGMTSNPLHFDQGLLYINGKELDDIIVMPEGVSILRNTCFEYGLPDGGISKLVLPKSLKTIETRNSLPYKCEIEYKGTKEEFSKTLLPYQSSWNNIDFMKIKSIKCIDGEIIL